MVGEELQKQSQWRVPQVMHATLRVCERRDGTIRGQRVLDGAPFPIGNRLAMAL